MKAKVLTYQGAVQTWECDSNDHMNVMYYINKFELAGRNLGFEMGTTNQFLKERDWGIAVVEQNIQYLHEVMEDDLLRVESWVTRVGNKSFSVIHEMISREQDRIVSIMKVSLVFLDKKARKAVPIPSEIKSKIQALILSEPQA